MCDSIRDSMHCVTACHGPTYFTEVSRKSFAIPECVLAPLMVENRWDDGAVQLAECTVMLNFPNEQRKCSKKRNSIGNRHSVKGMKRSPSNLPYDMPDAPCLVEEHVSSNLIGPISAQYATRT